LIPKGSRTARRYRLALVSVKRVTGSLGFARCCRKPGCEPDEPNAELREALGANSGAYGAER